MDQKNLFIFFICLVSCPLLAWTLARATQPLPDKVCDGTKNALSFNENKTRHFKRIRERYENCTFVSGNLELTHIETDEDFGFLKQIREVTGYVLISHVQKSTVSLPNLRVIRGQGSLYEGKYSLAVILNSGVQELSIPNLREIVEGSVLVDGNPSLCFFPNHINWEDLFSDGNKNRLHVPMEPPIMCASHCHPSCNNSFCWGPASNQCQKFTRVNCAPGCQPGRCFGPGQHECCNSECVGGCVGSKPTECMACRNFDDDGLCVLACPPEKFYDKVTMQHVPNPNAKFTYANLCMKECPDFMLKDESACVRSCQTGKVAIGKECIRCEGVCPKRCKGFPSPKDLPAGAANWISKNNIENFTNCTIIEGNLIILSSSFDGGMAFDSENSTYHDPITPEDLQALSTIKEITGYLRIDGSHINLTSLSFLRNLEIISGRILDDRRALTVIRNPFLKTLGLKSLRKIEAGGITIAENTKLCLADSVPWNQIASSNIDQRQLVVKHNKAINACIEAEEVCHPECTSGCWSRGRDQCFKCRNYKLKDLCVGSCDERFFNESYAYDAGDRICKMCDSQCLGCTGPGPKNCTKCLNVKFESECRPNCPISHYADSGNLSNGTMCLPCHLHCSGGCSGPGHHVGIGGCNSCEVGVVKENGKQQQFVEQCLSPNSSCPDKYFLQYGDSSMKELSSMAGKKLCRPCHPECAVCQGGTEHCSSCVHFSWKGRCVPVCPKESYLDHSRRACIECSQECGGLGCYGSLTTQCRNCKFYRDYYEEGNASVFNCTSKCPVEREFSSIPETPIENNSEHHSEPVCSAIDEAKGRTSFRLTIGLSVGLGITAISIIALVFLCLRKAKLKNDNLTLIKEMTCIEDTEPFTPTDAKPNTSKIIVIGEKELRIGGVIGSGAFGFVHKGVWLPPKGAGKKIPVAIKILKEPENSAQQISNAEIYDEAMVMASVYNPHLVRLIGICMTSQIMLITQLLPLGCLLEYVRAEKNMRNINSKMMLNWSAQIAKGMYYLESRHMIHRDLACRNVLVQTPLWVKVTDFGLAKMLDVNQEQFRSEGGKMPVKWLAPECMQNGTYSHKTDVWAFGITIWEILTYGKKPYEDVAAKDLLDYLEGGHRLEQPAICSIDVFMLILKCWSPYPESRPTFMDLVREFSKMVRDPCRYLVILGDEKMRMPDYTEEDQRRLMGEFDDGPEQVVCADEYLEHSFDNSDPGNSAGSIPSKGYQNGHLQTNGGLRFQWPDPAGATVSAAPASRVPVWVDNRKDSPPHSRYAMDPVKGGSKYGEPVPYSLRKKGSITLGLDNYLEPRNGTAIVNDTYLDLTDSIKEMDASLVEEYQKCPLLSNRRGPRAIFHSSMLPPHSPNTVNNPEYHLMSSGASNVSSDSDQARTSSFSVPGEEDDHEYYNKPTFDKMRKEMIPLNHQPNEPTFDKMRKEMIPLNHQPRRNETTV